MLTDSETRTATLAERAFVERIGGSCTTLLAAYARRTGTGLRLDASACATPDGAGTLRDGAVEQAVPAEAALGRELAEQFLAAGATEIIRAGQVA